VYKDCNSCLNIRKTLVVFSLIGFPLKDFMFVLISVYMINVLDCLCLII